MHPNLEHGQMDLVDLEFCSGEGEDSLRSHYGMRAYVSSDG